MKDLIILFLIGYCASSEMAMIICSLDKENLAERVVYIAFAPIVALVFAVLLLIQKFRKGDN